MSFHRYPPRALVGDYLRASLGFVLTGAPLLLGSTGSAMIYVLAPLALLFAVFGVRTVLRQATQVEVSDEGIRAIGPIGATVSWERLSLLRLRYYSSRRGRSRRDESDGWLQATIGDDARRIRIDSALTDFDAVILRAHAEARARGLQLDEATRHNLKAVGLAGDEAG